jgi:hypothetical protein
MKINVQANSAPNTSGPAIQEADNSPNNNLIATLATSYSGSTPQDGARVGSATAAPHVLSTDKTLDDADQAVNNMQPALSMAITTAKVITTASDAIDDVVSVYQTWEKAVSTIEAVMVVVDKIAEVIVDLSAYS